uniref:Uncharacterized protein n=1 Tax=Triticum urartu TaxID=4572 RepID=A0A8R7UP45_TRIUA
KPRRRSWPPRPASSPPRPPPPAASSGAASSSSAAPRTSPPAPSPPAPASTPPTRAASPSPATSARPTARSRRRSGRRRSGTASTSPRGRRWRSSGQCRSSSRRELVRKCRGSRPLCLNCRRPCRSCRAAGCARTTPGSGLRKPGRPTSWPRRRSWMRPWLKPASSEHCFGSSSRKPSRRHRLGIKRGHKTDYVVLYVVLQAKRPSLASSIATD